MNFRFSKFSRFRILGFFFISIVFSILWKLYFAYIGFLFVASIVHFCLFFFYGFQC